MNSNGRYNLSQNQNGKKTEIGLKDLIIIVKRRLNTILISTISILLLVIMYNFFASPVYEAAVTLKKEVINNRGATNEFKQMFSMQTMDELDTEIEIIKTRTVLEELIKELDILVYIEKIEFSNGEIRETNSPLFKYNNLSENAGNGRLPQFSNFEIDLNNPFVAKEYYIKIAKPNIFELYDYDTDILIHTEKYDSTIKFDLGELRFDLTWPYGKNEDRIYFKIKNIESVVKSLQGDIGVSKVGKSNVFKVSYRSESPATAQLIANTVVEKYRENRLSQKRQSIHSSFEFVDGQLQEISDKLKNTELELGLFKSEHKITNMAESSSEIVRSLSNLESEKVKTDLELAEFRNKLREMKREQQKKGYIDQTYLSPDGGSNGDRSPFSVLLRQLSDAEIKRLELIQRRRESHPDVVTIDEQISQIESRLAEYNKNTMTSYQIIINTLRKKQYNLARLIEKSASKLENLPSQETALIELMRNKNAYEKMFTLLLDKREELRLAEFSKLQDLIIIDPARTPFEPVSPRKALNFVLGIFLGLAIGFTAIFIQEFLNKKISSVDDFEKQYPYPILAVLPKFDQELKNKIESADDLENRLVVLMEDQLAFRESFRVLRTKLLQLLNENGDKKTLMFTSCEENTGKTTVAANYAMTLARTGKKVLVIDCDLRKSSMAKYLKISEDSPGLLQLLTNKLDTPVIYRPFVAEKSTTQIINFIPAGGCVENSSELLDSQKMGVLLRMLHSQYDYILLDTAPVTRIVDTLVLGRYVKNVIIIVRPDFTFKDSLSAGIEEMRQADMNVLGTVINASDIRKMSDKYKYGYGYGYGYGHGAESVGEMVK